MIKKSRMRSDEEDDGKNEEEEKKENGQEEGKNISTIYEEIYQRE